MKDPVSQAYATFNKAIDKIMAKKPGPERWRACVDLWLTFPGARAQYNQLIKENAQTRSLLNKHGFSHDKMKDADRNLRNALALPHTLYYLIQRADPLAFQSKKNGPRMFNALREFTTREVY